LKSLKNRAYGCTSKFGLTFDQDARRFSGRDGAWATRKLGWELSEQELIPLEENEGGVS
jgi:hypothetical protein